jgi:hypothetical protein
MQLKTSQKTHCVYQKVRYQAKEITLGQAGPKVMEIAAILAQHQRAQLEEPSSKKRNQGSLDEGNGEGKIGITEENEKKVERELSMEVGTCTKDLAGLIIVSLLSWNCWGLRTFRQFEIFAGW